MTPEERKAYMAAYRARVKAGGPVARREPRAVCPSGGAVKRHREAAEPLCERCAPWEQARQASLYLRRKAARTSSA